MQQIILFNGGVLLVVVVFIVIVGCECDAKMYHIINNNHIIVTAITLRVCAKKLYIEERKEATHSHS